MYITAIFSAFTFSIFHGVVFGLAINAIIVLLTGEFTNSLKHIFPNISDYFCLRTDDLSTHSVDPDKDTVRLASNEHSTTDFDAINKRRYGSVGDENDQNGAFMYHCEEQMVVTTKEDLYAVQLSRVVQLQSLQDVLGTSSNSGKVNIHNNSIHGTGGVTSPKIKQTIPTVDGYDSETRNCLLDEVQIGIEEQRFDDDNNISFKKEYNSISHRSKSLDV